MTEDKLEALKAIIQNHEQITEQDKKWVTQDFLKYCKRTGAQKDATQANYLAAIEKIVTQHTDLNISQLDELDEEQLTKLNEQVADNIQDSQYRKTQGETCQRGKRHLWTTWKKALETHGITTSRHEPYMPKVKFTTNKGKVNSQANTKPEDLPTPSQTKEFVRKLGETSGESVKLRNQALILLLWDKGLRIGEALRLKMKNVDVNSNGQLHIDVTETVRNKKSKPRDFEVLQGRKTLIDYIQQHPGKKDDEAYLFAKLKHEELYTELSKKPLRRKIHQTRSQGNFSFKTEGEPFHIFRKAMKTSHIVNEWATWEQICTWVGKKDDGTKPDYVKIATSDVDASVAEKMGARLDLEAEGDSRMLGDPLLPKNCSSCDRLNRCYVDTCQYCGGELPDSQMPKNKEQDEEEIAHEKLNAQLKQVLQIAEEAGVDTEELEINEN